MTETQHPRWTAYTNHAVWNVSKFNAAKWGNAAHAWTGWSVDNLSSIANTLEKMLRDIVPSSTHVAPPGDHVRESTDALFDDHRECLQILSHLHPNDAMSEASKTLLAHSSVPRMVDAFEAWADDLYDPGNLTAQPLSRLPKAQWAAASVSSLCALLGRWMAPIST